MVGVAWSMSRAHDGEDRRDPRLTSTAYLVLKPLARFIQAFAEGLVRESPCVVVDIGCGDAPYRTLFARSGVRYVGVDRRPSAGARAIGASEALPIRTGAVDGVLCTQLLEHAESPVQTLREIARILRPGGRAFVSAPGAYVYHPSPHDYWRWTEEGLRKVLRDTGAFTRIEIAPCGGTLSSLFLLWALELQGLAPLKYTVIPILNLLGEALDRAFPRADRGAPLIANFAATMERTGP